MINIDLSGKTALVTGVSDNIGFAWHKTVHWPRPYPSLKQAQTQVLSPPGPAKIS